MRGRGSDLKHLDLIPGSMNGPSQAPQRESLLFCCFSLCCHLDSVFIPHIESAFDILTFLLFVFLPVCLKVICSSKAFIFSLFHLHRQTNCFLCRLCFFIFYFNTDFCDSCKLMLLLRFSDAGASLVDHSSSEARVGNKNSTDYRNQLINLLSVLTHSD